MNVGYKKGFTLAEMFVAKREKGKTRELKEPSSRFIKQSAFTLAEVLITLGIIGVVAAMTIPTLMNNTQEKEYVSSLKKTFSILANAQTLAENENGNIMSWSYTSDAAQNSKTVFDNIKPYLKISKECGYSDGCWTPTVYSFNNFNGPWSLTNTTRYWFILNDGTFIGINAPGAISDSGSIAFYIDVNGAKKPNVAGVDIFQVSMKNNKLTDYDTKNGAPTCYTNSFTCSSWVLANDNLDYLHCTDLNWQTKLKCN